MNGWMIRSWSSLLVALLVATGHGAEDRVFRVNLGDSAVARLQQRHEYLMSLDEDELVALVPVQSGIWYTDCPNCDGATQDSGNWDWTPRDPGHITCRDCGEVYPGNSKYPETGRIEVEAPEGTHVYPYWERPGDNYRIFFQARVDSLARQHMDRACRDLAQLYDATQDERYARRAALILIRFAEVYPGYALAYDYPFRAKAFWPYNATEIDHPAIRRSPDRLSKYDWWRYMAVGEALVEAYDVLRDWPPLKEMADGRAVQLIENDLLGAMVDFALGYPDPLTNMGPTNWRRVIGAGRVLRRPEYVHEAVERFERFLTTQFLYDGHWKETSPSYNAQCIGGIRVIRSALRGYTDPPGYQHPESGKRLDDQAIQKLFARYDRSAETVLRPRLPDGRLLPLNDTWWTSTRTPRTSMRSDLLPGLGAAILGGGAGHEQLHVHLNFSSGLGHKHRDALSLGLFAHGKELLPDLGYTHTAWRAFVNSTISHNTVVVNGVEQRYDPDWSGNRLRAFVADGHGLQLAEAESVAAYPELRRYRRSILVIGHDSTDAYIVDVFQVSGGAQHDYLLHGSADDDSLATVRGADMAEFDGTLMNPGVRFREPRGENDGVGDAGAFGFVRNLTRGLATGMIVLDMRLKDHPELGTRSWLDAEANTHIYLGEAPSIRRARSTDRDLPRYMAPFFSARRQGDDLESLFVAVHEPVQGRPRITDVQVSRQDEAVVVTVVTDDGTDHAVVGLSDQSRASWETATGPAQFQGRFGLVRTGETESLRQAHLVGGDELVVGDSRVGPAPVLEGNVLGIQPHDDGTSYGLIDVDQALPTTVVDRVLIVHHPDGSTQAYRINRQEPINDGTRLYTAEDAGFAYTSSGLETITFPRRRIEGHISRFEVLTSTTQPPPSEP
jgi:hypothetical protein